MRQYLHAVLWFNWDVLIWIAKFSYHITSKLCDVINASWFNVWGKKKKSLSDYLKNLPLQFISRQIACFLCIWKAFYYIFRWHEILGTLRHYLSVFHNIVWLCSREQLPDMDKVDQSEFFRQSLFFTLVVKLLKT